MRFRDPNNVAFECDGVWYRIARPQSAAALRELRAAPIYEQLVSTGAIPAFERVSAEISTVVLERFAKVSPRPLHGDETVFETQTCELVSYPWEWTNTMLAEAGQHTLLVRARLLELGLDLKDASALNITFVGRRPMLMDLGSVERWRPNPSWNALRQFVENFINPLAVSNSRVPAAAVWRLGGRQGLRSDQARTMLRLRRRLSPGLWVLQATTMPGSQRKPVEQAFKQQSEQQRSLARQATLSLTRKLGKRLRSLTGTGHKTTWGDYSDREHYTADQLETKASLSEGFAQRWAPAGRAIFVADVGGNDGLIAKHLQQRLGARTVVLDADAGALEVLCDDGCHDVSHDPALAPQPLLADVLDLPPTSGAGDEFLSLRERLRPDVVLCQAVLHHLVITQGAPMQLVVDALIEFGAPLQIEFAEPSDPKVQLLLSLIPNWVGEYSTDCLLDSLRRRFAQVEIAGRTSEHRVVVNAWDALPG